MRCPSVEIVRMLNYNNTVGDGSARLPLFYYWRFKDSDSSQVFYEKRRHG